MSVALARDPVLARIKADLVAMDGDRLDRVVPFGSRARGDATEVSDYDAAVFLRDFEMAGVWPKRYRLAEFGFRIVIEQDTDLQIMPFPIGGEAERTMLMHETRKDGVVL